MNNCTPSPIGTSPKRGRLKIELQCSNWGFSPSRGDGDSQRGATSFDKQQTKTTIKHDQRFKRNIFQH